MSTSNDDADVTTPDEQEQIENALRLLADVPAHPCGYPIEDDHNAHYAGACPCYGYG